MSNNPATAQRLASLISTILDLTTQGKLHWERQVNSAHRYARWNGNLLILGPSENAGDSSIPRYLFITPFDSPNCIEINSNDDRLGDAVLKLVKAVEQASASQPPTDPFSISGDILDRLEN